ncbi:MAG: ABC transporter permease [Thermonemataceae bacterium]
MFRLSFQIAKTQMLERPKQTLIATLGVTFGIGMFVFMVSFMTGVNVLLEETMLAATPHIRIYNEAIAAKTSVLDEYKAGEAFVNVVHNIKPKEEKQNIKNAFQMVDYLRADERVLGVSPQLTSQVFYNFGPIQINGTLVGVDIFEEDKLFDLESKIQTGRLENLLTSSNAIIMGADLAERLNMQVNDKVTVSTPDGTLKLLKVVGTFRFGVGAIDDSKSYTSIATVQKILKEDTRYITDINVKLKDYYQAGQIAREYDRKFDYTIEDWEAANASTLSTFLLRDIITYAVSITLLVVAGFGIYNIMNMTIYEKMKDIAILKAMGFAGRDVLSIFLIQAISIGLMGAASGLLIGFLLSLWIDGIPFETGGVLSVDTFPVNYDIKYYLIGLVFGLLTTGLAGYFPARKAAKIDPVEIIRS